MRLDTIWVVRSDQPFSAKFSVTEMKQDDFVSLEAYKKTLTVRNHTYDAVPISW